MLILSIHNWSSLVPSQAQSSTYPHVVSITRTATPPTDMGLVTFVVTFSQAVTGVDTTDFMVVAHTTDVIVQTIIATADPTIYHVIVTQNNYTDPLFLAVIDDDSIRNDQAVPLGGLGVQNGNTLSTSVAPMPQLTNRVHEPRVGGVNVGVESDIALTNTKTNKNTPVIAYYDSTNKTLKLAICNNLTCTNPVMRTITGPTQNGSTDWGRSPSLVLAKGEIPIISYYDKTNGDLWLTICGNPLCTSLSSQLIDGVTKDVGEYSALALTKTGIPVISYANKTDVSTMLAVCNTTKCTAVNVQSIIDGNYGSYNDMVLSTSDRPVMVSYDTINDYLTYATCADLRCIISPTTMTLSGQVYDKPSLALTKTNLPVFSFYDHDTNKLLIQYCQNVDCSSLGTASTIENDCNCVPALALTSDDTPIVVYSKYDGSNYTLKMAQCNELDCGSPTITTLYDNSPSYGAYPAISITDNNIPVVSYYDDTNGRLRLHYDLPAIDSGAPLRFNKVSATITKQGSMATATIKWLAAPDATSYEYCVQQSPSYCSSSSPSWVSVGNTTTTAVQFLPMATTFYWQVRAVNGAGRTLATGGFATFTTK